MGFLSLFSRTGSYSARNCQVLSCPLREMSARTGSKFKTRADKSKDAARCAIVLFCVGWHACTIQQILVFSATMQREMSNTSEVKLCYCCLKVAMKQLLHTDGRTDRQTLRVFSELDYNEMPMCLV